jgi:hypothetical protein
MSGTTGTSAGAVVPGDIVQVDFPYVRPYRDENGKIIRSKPRPALVLYIERNQMVAAYISSKPVIIPNPGDVIVLETSPSFEETGLPRSSVIRLGVLATLPLHNINGLYGSVDAALRTEINSKLGTCFRI